MKLIDRPLEYIKSLVEVTYDELQSAEFDYNNELQKILFLSNDLSDERYILAKIKYQNLANKLNHYRQTLNNKINGVINKRQYHDKKYFDKLHESYETVQLIIKLTKVKPWIKQLPFPFVKDGELPESVPTILRSKYGNHTHKLLNYWLIISIYNLHEKISNVFELLNHIKKHRILSKWDIHEYIKPMYFNVLVCLDLVQVVESQHCIVLTDLGHLMIEAYTKHELLFNSKCSFDELLVKTLNHTQVLL